MRIDSEIIRVGRAAHQLDSAGGSLSVLRHLDVGDQYTYAAGGESRHGGEERACFRVVTAALTAA